MLHQSSPTTIFWTEITAVYHGDRFLLLVFSRSYFTQLCRVGLAIGLWYCCPSVRLWRCGCGAQGWCRGWKVIVFLGRQLPIQFFRHFCCKMYHFATIAVDVLFIRSRQRKTQRPKCPCLEIFRRHFRQFGSADIPYVVRSTIGLLSDSYASW